MSSQDDYQTKKFPSDYQMIEWLELQNRNAAYTGRCIFRQSSIGRGWRLHETSRDNSHLSVREAIKTAMIEDGSFSQ